MDHNCGAAGRQPAAPASIAAMDPGDGHLPPTHRRPANAEGEPG